MSLPNRDNPHNFDEFLEWRDNVNFLKEYIRSSINEGIVRTQLITFSDS